MKRLIVSVMSLPLVVALGGCSTFRQDPAATVNDDEISDDVLQDELDDVEGSEAYRTFLEAQLGRVSKGSGTGTVATPFVSALLTERVYLTLIEQALDAEDASVSEAQLAEARQQLEDEGGEGLGDLPRDQRDALARRVALLQALQAEAVPAYFERNADDFDTLCVSHVLVGTEDRSVAEAEARAEELAERIDAGERFRRLARTESDDETAAAQRGDLGCGTRGRFVAPFEDAAFQLEVGEVSAPVRTEFGFHLIRLRERTASGLEEVDDAVQQRLIADLAAEADVSVDPRYGEWTESESGSFQIVAPSEGGA
ncbi:hypothetical protein BH18ACT1_BH18ACT1_08230 [soil metagenome]